MRDLRVIAVICVIASPGCDKTPSAPAGPPAPATSGESEVTFQGAGGVTLKGTLTLPKAAKAPALLLIPGSGPTDRNGNQPPTLMTDLLKEIAQRLAAKGYASLRFDKRAAHVYSTLWPKDLVGQNNFFAWDNFVDDSVHAYTFLKKQPGVDPKRVGILGHSEGGLIALSAANVGNKEDWPGFLVLIGTAGRPLKVVVHEQVAQALERQKATPFITSQYLDKCDAISAEVIRTGKVPSDVPAGLMALFPPSAAGYLQSVLPLDPLGLARRFTGPVLVMNGEKDIQVSSTRDAKPLFDALSDGKREIFIVPGASHNLKAVTSDPAGFIGPALPAALGKLTDWLGKAVTR